MGKINKPTSKINQDMLEGLDNQPKQTVGYDDFDFSVSNLTQRAGGKPDKDYDNDEWLFDDGSTETVVGSKISRHEFQTVVKEGETQILWHPHIHWMQEGVNNPSWELKVKFIPAGQLEGSWLTFSNAVPEFIYTSGALHQISVFSPIDVSSIISTAVEVKIQVSRLGASDTYVGDARFMGFDFHVPQDQPSGSRQEYIK